MRRVFVRSLIAVAAAIALVSCWIAGARSVSMLLDRVHTVEIESQPLTEFGLEEVSGGMIRINGMPMNTRILDDRSFPMTIARDAQGRFVITIKDKSIALGSPVERAEGGSGIVIKPEPGDHATFSIDRSFMSWPTPLDINFMSGHSPSWKRHLYYRLLWQKPDGAKFEMLWRYEQYLYPGDGWASGFMIRDGSTGLLRAKVQD